MPHKGNYAKPICGTANGSKFLHEEFVRELRDQRVELELQQPGMEQQQQERHERVGGGEGLRIVGKENHSVFNVEYEDMYHAYICCRKRKKKKKDAKEFELNALFNITSLVDEINDGKYKLRPSSCFIVEYPTAREVFCAAFRDRVV